MTIKSKIKNSTFSCAMLLFLLLAACHHTDEPPEQKASVQLTAVDTGVVDAMIRVRVTNVLPPYTVTIKRDGQTIFTDAHSVADTTIADTALLPKHAYSYRAYWSGGALGMTDSSDALPLTTMDTTTHDFVFQLDTIGVANSSFADVCIINDTLAYAVGEIYLRDSTGRMYNAARWNGNSWSLIKIPTALFGGFVDTTRLTTVYGFASNDIWTFSDAGSYSHWDGTHWSTQFLSQRSGGGVKLWGTSSRNLYLTTTSGSISRYNGTAWEKMETGVTTSLLDIGGSPDGAEVWACGWEDFKPTVLLRLVDGAWKIAYQEDHPFTQRNDSLSGQLTSLFVPSGRRLEIASPYGIYDCWAATLEKGTRQSFSDTYFPGFPFRIRGNDINDFFVAGEFNVLAHYNGSSWKYFSEFYNQGELHSMDQKDRSVIAVGYSFDPINRHGIILTGRR